MIPNKCTVIRDGIEQKIEATELVVGDLVRLYIGDRIPADIRIIENFDLKVRWKTDQFSYSRET
jgi:magnesium-transporting ATPase (P-type)